MKLIVGLGNPGREYAGTRHNVGFDAVDLLAARHRAGVGDGAAGAEALIAQWRADGALLAKPLTFMNLSGQAVAGCCSSTRSSSRPAGRRRRCEARSGPAAGPAVGFGGRAQRVEVAHRRTWAPTSFSGCGLAWGAETPGGIWRITCWRSSTGGTAGHRRGGRPGGGRRRTVRQRRGSSPLMDRFNRKDRGQGKQAKKV